VPVCMYVCVCARSYDVCMLCMDTYIYIYIYIFMYDVRYGRCRGWDKAGRSFQAGSIQLQIYYIIANIVTIYNKYSRLDYINKIYI